MPQGRFYIDTAFSSGAKIELKDDEAHHLAKVMRIGVGDTVELINGHLQLAHASVLQIEKRRVFLEIIELHQESPPLFPIILCQAIPKLNRLENIVEKGTELGMTSLWLFPGEHSEKKSLSPNQIERLHLIRIAALKQCGRLDLPSIEIKSSLSDWREGDWIYPSFYGATQALAPLFKPPKDTGLLIFIGPESGFSSNEELLLQKKGALGVKLHMNILRTDTASLAALSIIQHKRMEDA